MRPARVRQAVSKRKAISHEGTPDRKRSKNHDGDEASFLIDLSKPRREGSSGALEKRAVGKLWLKELIDQGVVVEDSKGGRISLAGGPESFGKAFLICDRAGRSRELLASEYASSSITTSLLVEASKAAVRASIFNLLRFVSSASKEAREDPTLSSLGAWLDQSEQAAIQLDRISSSLARSGFHELLEFDLGGLEAGSIEEERLRIIADMAERDIAVFFADKPIVPGLPELFLSALFPEDERDTIFDILKSSPSAMRALLLAKDARSSSLSLASLQQILPILSRLFEIFADTDPKLCNQQARNAWGKELAALVDPSKGHGQSPILRLLEARCRLDSEAGSGQLR